MTRALSLLLAAGLAACAPSYSPDDYATRAVQQMNRVEQAVVIGVRNVTVTADGATGATTGAAAGGIIGSQTPGTGIVSAIGGVGGALVGGLLGSASERVAGNTTAIEYIVRKTNGELLSVTQRDETPLPLGARVLVIAGAQARIVPDYTQSVPGEAPATPPAPAATAATPPPATATVTPAPVPAALAPPPLPGPPPTVPAPPPAPPAAELLLPL